MKDGEIRQRNIGVNFKNGLAEVLIWAPNAERVALIVEKIEVDMVRQKLGYWKLLTPSLKPGMSYQIGLDGKAYPDITSLMQPDVHGPSVAIDLQNYNWKDDDWKNHDLRDYIIYELHTGTFTPEGSFRGISEKFDHLIDLGVNAIELMPLAQFPGGRNWGYDGVYPFAVQNSYCAADGLRNLIDLCHQKGLAVIIDVVYNHIGPEGNYFSNYGPYFTEKYQTPWGNAINFDDAQCDAVRRYFIENVLMWFRDFHADALRLDAVHAIKDFSPKHILQEIREYTDRLMELTGQKHYLIVECDLNDTRFINSAATKGYGMDAQWIDEFHHALRVAAGGKKNGYYSDFDGIPSLAEAFKNAYVYHGQYSQHRKKYFGTDTAGNPGEQFVVFSQNHDQVGNRMLGERSSQLFSAAMQRLMAAAVMVSPYLPMLFMGEEWSASTPFQYFVSHSDEHLIQAVREGRKAEFKDFHGDGEAPDPQSEETFLTSRLDWDELAKEPHRHMLNYYRALITLRKKLPALKYPERGNLAVNIDEQMNLLTLRRTCEEQDLICLMNFSQVSQTPSVEEDFREWQQVFNSADPYWQGLAATPAFQKEVINAGVAPESITIYSRYHV